MCSSDLGYISSASYGHTLGGSVGMGYVKADVVIDAAWVNAGRYEIEVGGDKVPARASLAPLYDPKSLRTRDVAA